MKDLISLLKNKVGHFCVLPCSNVGGGVATSDYTVEGCVDGFKVLADNRHRTTFCRLDQIGKNMIVTEIADKIGEQQ